MLKSWLFTGVRLPSRRRRWQRLVLAHQDGPNLGQDPNGSNGGGGGGGVSAPPSTGGGGGGGGGGMQPPSAPPSSGGGIPASSGLPYAPPQPQQQAPSALGADPQLNMSDSLRAALDGTGPGYNPAVQPQAVAAQQGQQWQAPPIPGQNGQQPVQQQQTPAEWAALREQMNRYGIPIPENVTPEQGYAQIAQSMRTAQERNYALEQWQQAQPQWQQFQQWQQYNNQQVQQPQQQQEQGLWNPPQFKQEWLDLVEQDPNTGKLRSKFGYDSRYGTMAQEYADYMQGQQREMWNNPQQYMWKMIEPLVNQAMQGQVQQSFGQYQEELTAGNLLNQHKQWIYQFDPQGRPIFDAQRNPVMTPNGVKYNQYVVHAARQLGMRSVAEQNDYAMAMLERDLLRQQWNQQRAQQQAQQPQQFQQQQPFNPGAQAVAPFQPPPSQIPAGAGHFGNVNQLQTMQPQGPGNPQPTNPPASQGRSLFEMMRDGMAADGVTDADIRNDMQRAQGGNSWQ